MSSYLQKQQEAFRGNVISASSKISNKRTLGANDAQPTSAPSPSPSNASTTSKNEPIRDKKRKAEPPATNIVYSQPADTGYGTDMLTQVQYIIKYLKDKGEAKTFKDILGYLGLPAFSLTEPKKRILAGILRQHPRIKWKPDPTNNNHDWDGGLFEHRPTINVRNSTELLAYLQKKVDAQGVSVKDLKDGWDKAEEGITQLEREHKVLVTRTKKDNHARMVWADDPSLYHPIDLEFANMWKGMELPSPDDVVTRLIAQGQKPASDDPAKRVKQAPKPKEKKKRAGRAGGKTTNTHMQHLLKDYPEKTGR